MKKNLFLIVFLIGIAEVFSQDYDLIITNEGDSIACRIDSITMQLSFLRLSLIIFGRILIWIWIRFQNSKDWNWIEKRSI